MECKSISLEARKNLFKHYYSTDQTTQGTYLMNLIHIGKIKRRRHGTYVDPTESRRQATIYYTLPNGTGDVVNVCRSTFMNTFGITKRHVSTLSKKKKSGETTFIEKRRRTAGGKFTSEDRRMVRDHINSIPRDMSHYSRQRTEKEYFSPDLNINRLHKAFHDKYPDSRVTYKFYRLVFLKDLPNLSFRRPRSDTCRVCDKLHCEVQARNENSHQAKINLDVHHLKAENARKCMKSDITEAQLPGSEFTAISMDLEQVLFVPTLTHSDMFYMSQLSCYNLCINLADLGISYMCLWYEGIAGRGGNEISSCLLHILNNINPSNKKKITIWSDNCASQNKNRMIVFIYIFLVSVGLYETIDHKFLVSGHSFLQCDRDFALIEKRKRKCKPMVPADWRYVIESSANNGKFQVVDMQRFFNIQKAADSILNLKAVQISKTTHIRIDARYPGMLLCKQSVSDFMDFQKIPILKKGKTIQDIQKITLEELPHENHIGTNKKKHLQAMIPFLEKQEHKDFYSTLIK